MDQAEKTEKRNNPSIIKNPVIRTVVLIFGWFFVLLALLGAILPLIPTTPFLVAAAAAFYRSSDKFYHWIMTNRLFGHYLQDYKAGRGIPVRVKITALSFSWLSTIISIIFFIPWLWLKILVFAITSAITVHVLMMKTRPS
jgi:uncharacterized membrane protein YbaN (DUF454 family)